VLLFHRGVNVITLAFSFRPSYGSSVGMLPCPCCAFSSPTPLLRCTSGSVCLTPHSHMEYMCLPFTLDIMCKTARRRLAFSHLSRFYSTAPWYYYLPQALPLLAIPAFPFVPQAIFVQVLADLIYLFTLRCGLARCSRLRDRRKALPVPTRTNNAHSFSAFQHTHLIVEG